MSPRRLLLLFLLMNVLNYVDRQVLAGIAPLLKDHFELTDTHIGLLGSAFMITYSLTAVPFGAWSDRWFPHKVAALGVAIWSVATVGSGLAWSFVALFVFRALVGVGEAAYVSTAGTILSGAYPERQRSAALGLFNLGMPIGGAIGVMAGAAIGAAYGWEWAFFLVGLPGLLLAWICWRLPLEKQASASDRPKFTMRELSTLLKNRAFLFTSLGYAGISFAFGAIVIFLPTFFNEELGYSLEDAGFVAGVLQVLAGLTGAPLGGLVADFWQKRNPRGRAYTLVISMLLSAILLALGLWLENLVVLFFSAFFMLWHVGVASALVFDVTERAVWNTAAAFALLIMHLLGDIPSPTIVGFLSEQTSLLTAFSVLPIAMLLSAWFFYLAGKNIRR